VYWRYFSTPRASCRRGEHEVTACLVNEFFPNKPELSSGLVRAKGNVKLMSWKYDLLPSLVIRASLPWFRHSKGRILAVNCGQFDQLMR